MKTIRIDGEIADYWVSAEWLNYQIGDEKEISLIINSPGGSIPEGFAIFNLLKDFRGNGGYIEARIDLAASMASVIAMAANKIIMRSNSSLMMIHKPWTNAQGEAEDFRRIAATLDKFELRFEAWINLIPEFWYEEIDSFNIWVNDVWDWFNDVVENKE